MVQIIYTAYGFCSFEACMSLYMCISIHMPNTYCGQFITNEIYYIYVIFVTELTVVAFNNKWCPRHRSSSLCCSAIRMHSDVFGCIQCVLCPVCHVSCILNTITTSPPPPPPIVLWVPSDRLFNSRLIGRPG